MPSDTLLYEQDFVTWTERQAEALRRLAHEGSNLPLDFDHLAEEIESLSRETRHKACSPADQPRAKWMSQVDAFRFQLRDSPAIRAEFAHVVQDGLPQAFKMAQRNFRHFAEDDALWTLVAWRLRGASAEEVLQDDLYPVGGSTSLEMDDE